MSEVEVELGMGHEPKAWPSAVRVVEHEARRS
jgi:hypothetical protein